ncbi:MAG TPA: hypothetical protein ENH99_01585 [Candidatus Pacearchaeota archaeon]|uniref:Uncharacterized protein n=1 Tax=marine sediment metagenome TaxID=412755 RepID=A0A0F9JYF0_9ZZZZ|nr:hypothetical protein [Candidatus Pacearchaeota archaeon]
MKLRKLNLTIPEEVYKNIKNRKGFIPSQYLTEKYLMEFMGEKTIKKEIEEKTKELEELKVMLVDKKPSTVKSKDDPRRCVLCSMFFNEKITFRKKVPYKGFNFCSGCVTNRKEEVDAKIELFERVK